VPESFGYCEVNRYQRARCIYCECKMPTRSTCLRALVLAAQLGCISVFATAQRCLEVHDASGAVVVSAMVTTGRKTFHADQTGRIQLEASVVRVKVRAPTFEPQDVLLTTANACQVITLSPQTVSQQIVVTPTRRELPEKETMEQVHVVSSAQLKDFAALTIDDLLRGEAGFTLFRRTSSLVSNPTSQGISLRGVGASGASRALVLRDGVPLNDPFGGWVYWSRVAPASVGSV